MIGFGLLLAANVAGKRYVPDHVRPPTAAKQTAQPYITPKRRIPHRKKRRHVSGYRSNSLFKRSGEFLRRAVFLLFRETETTGILPFNAISLFSPGNKSADAPSANRCSGSDGALP
jgi:hypothetical protein